MMMMMMVMRRGRFTPDAESPFESTGVERWQQESTQDSADSADSAAFLASSSF